MAQKSIPWGYLTGNDSAVGYVAKEDSAIRACIAKTGVMVVDNGIRTIAGFANLGPFYSVANRLAVTNPGGAANRIDVDTGASFCCGIFHYNSASVGAAGDIVSPAANPRIDRVVVRANFAAAAYVPANASAALFTVPTNTARVTIIHGAENAVPVAPSLTQDVTRATYWDIPLYQYQISVAGAITALTDEREWVDAETKRKIILPYTGLNVTDGTEFQVRANTLGIEIVDSKDCRVIAIDMVPNDFITDYTITPVVVPVANGNIYANLTEEWGSCLEDPGLHDDTVGFTAYAIVTTTNNCIIDHTITPVVAGDIIRMVFDRDATDPLDTIGASVSFSGFIISYLGWR